MDEKESEELPELTELEPLDELEPLPELPHDVAELEQLTGEAVLEELPVDPVAATAEAAAAAPADAASQRKDLDRAPILLQRAAIIVTVGSVLPWSSVNEIVDPPHALTWAGSLASKAILLVAIWVLYQSHVATHGGKVAGPLAGLGKINLGTGKKKINLLVIVSALLAIGGLMPIEGAFSFASFSEKLILLLAGYTFAHIYDYQHGGRFNPIYPIMFLAPAIGGLAAIFQVFPINVLAGLGAAAVCGGGALAIVTLGMAMKQAKIEGDAKKKAALEARKAARRAAGGGSAAPRPPRPTA